MAFTDSFYDRRIRFLVSVYEVIVGIVLVMVLHIPHDYYRKCISLLAIIIMACVIPHCLFYILEMDDSVHANGRVNISSQSHPSGQALCSEAHCLTTCVHGNLERGREREGER
jgi:hypothetical protein